MRLGTKNGFLRYENILYKRDLFHIHRRGLFLLISILWEDPCFNAEVSEIRD